LNHLDDDERELRIRLGRELIFRESPRIFLDRLMNEFWRFRSSEPWNQDRMLSFYVYFMAFTKNLPNSEENVLANHERTNED
jgi:hypothetical protein